MKKVKAILSVLLAIAVVLSLAVPAFAMDAHEDGVDTCAVSMLCPKCSNGAKSVDYNLTGARNVSHNGHTDVQTYYYDLVTCESCGSTRVNIRVISTYCPKA